jgi:hypothetical protein
VIRLIQNVYGNGSDEEGNGINMSRSKSSGNSKLGGLAGLCEVLEKEEGGQKWKAQFSYRCTTRVRKSKCVLPGSDSFEGKEKQ